MQNLFITLSTLNERNEISDNRIINSGFHIIMGRTTSDTKIEWKMEIRVNTNTHVKSIDKIYSTEFHCLSNTILAKTCLRGGSIVCISIDPIRLWAKSSPFRVLCAESVERTHE